MLAVPSYAKINLGLRILGKRPDGYHELLTLLQTVSLQDDLSFEQIEGCRLEFSCAHPDVPQDETNLILRAARLLQDRFRPPIGARICLEKRIPTRGGLGGASSNAAVTLLALTELWQLHLDNQQLVKLGSELGADVPFFFYGGLALASGIGTEVTLLPERTKLNLIIVTPNTAVSTAAAYAAVKAAALTTADSDPILARSRAEAFLRESDQWPLHNDFEDVIFEIEPEIKRVREALLDAGARCVLLAGSGSSVFGIVESADAQRRALKLVQAEAGWRVFACDTLSRSEYVRALNSGGTSLLRFSNSRFDSGA